MALLYFTDTPRLYAAPFTQQSEQGGAPTPANMDKYLLGEKTIRTIINAAYERRIGLQDAARLMNIPVSRFDKVMP